MDKKIIRYPISSYQLRKNINGPLCVECQVSGRTLNFHNKSYKANIGEFITIDVMAMKDDDDKPARKICELVVTREDLLEALKHISPEE